MLDMVGEGQVEVLTDHLPQPYLKISIWAKTWGRWWKRSNGYLVKEGIYKQRIYTKAVKYLPADVQGIARNLVGAGCNKYCSEFQYVLKHYVHYQSILNFINWKLQ